MSTRGSPRPVVQPLSLTALPDQSTQPVVLTPKSALACGLEGIDPSELVYRPLEDFVEKSLSPRLVKLRYDFYEAKRRDLIAAALKAREDAVSQESDNLRFLRERESAGAVKQERERLARAQADEKRWLENVLRNELRLFHQMEHDMANTIKEEQASDNREAERSVRMRLLNEQRREEDERKHFELEATMRADKEEAKQEFLRQLEHAKQQEIRATQLRRELHAHSVAEAEKRRQQEADRARQLRQEYQRQQDRLLQIDLKDNERLKIIEESKKIKTEQTRMFIEKRNQRAAKSQENNQQIELYKREEFLSKLEAESERELRLQEKKRQEAEIQAKRQLQTVLKRRHYLNEAINKSQQKRQAILAHRDQTEERLAEHEKKRQRFLAFKKELDSLKERNREMNVERQRKREEFKRAQIAELVETKDQKISTVNSFKQEIWGERRKAAEEARNARETVKREIMNMKVHSYLDSKKVESLVRNLLTREIPGNKIPCDSKNRTALKKKSDENTNPKSTKSINQSDKIDSRAPEISSISQIPEPAEPDPEPSPADPEPSPVDPEPTIPSPSPSPSPLENPPFENPDFKEPDTLIQFQSPVQSPKKNEDDDSPKFFRANASSDLSKFE